MRLAPAFGRRARGFTLVEAMMAALVLAVIFAGALHAVGASGADRVRAEQRAAANFLAEGLMNEILTHAYSAESKNQGGGVIGISIGGIEVSLGGSVVVELEGTGGGSSSSRSGFVSVDDYNGLIESPPCDVDGTELKEFARWSREVRVETVSAADGQTPSVVDQGLKLVTVTVKKGGGTVETRRALVADVP